MIGTNAEWFLRIVIFSFSLYSNRSPSSWALAEVPSRSAASARLAGAEAGMFAENLPRESYESARNLATPPPTPADFAAIGEGGGAAGSGAAKATGLLSSAIVPSWVCGV